MIEKMGVKASKEDFEKLKQLANRGWKVGQTMIVFSLGEGIRRDQATVDAERVCHELALKYGLPEIPGRYGIDKEGEFVKVV